MKGYDDMTKQLTVEEINAMIIEERKNPQYVAFTPIDPQSRLAKLYRMQSEAQRQRREAWEDKHYTKQIQCPEHAQGSHTAVLYQHGHRFAGIWECPVTGASDSCEHPNGSEVESVEVDDSHPDRSDGYSYEIYVCVDCGTETDGNPAEDRAEAIADMQIMEALGK